MPKIGASARVMRDELIRELRSQGHTLTEIGKHPGVQCSAMQVSRVLAAQKRAAEMPADGLTDVMRAELRELVPHPEQQVRLAHHRARFQDVSGELRAWLDAEVVRSRPHCKG